MAIYRTNFSEYSSGSSPQGWTRHAPVGDPVWTVENSSGIGSKSLYSTADTDFSRALSWDVIDSDTDRANVEIAAKVSFTDIYSYHSGVIVRGTSSQSAPYVTAGYILNFYKIGSTGFLRLTRPPTEILGSYEVSIANNSWYWIRLRANGSSIKAKVWADGDAEPSTWQIDVTDSYFPSAGFVGVSRVNGNGQDIHDVIGVGTNGDTAPSVELPEGTTDTATSVAEYTATLNGSISHIGDDEPARYFEYGLTTSYGSEVSLGPGGVGSFSSTITGLTSNTLYHYRIKLVATDGTVYGDDVTFTTLETFEYYPSNLSPINNIFINAQEEKTFSWSKDSLAVQTHYELAYRQVGNETWISTGTVSSVALSHTFSADTFNRDTYYEWKVKSWDSAHPTWYYWSEVVTFNTLYVEPAYFINPPSVKFEGLKATHITVRVKDSSPAVEYTAYITPEPTTDKRIERLVVIDDGVVGTCQAVAERLISEWGREQVSISGDIDLNVTLRFKKKIYVVDVNSAIDGEYTLQQKSHDIGNNITKIVVGDIILSDGELLARILDGLTKKG